MFRQAMKIIGNDETHGLSEQLSVTASGFLQFQGVAHLAVMYARRKGKA